MINHNEKLSGLKKLRHKAELNRHAHSRLKETKQAVYRGKKLLSVFLSILLTLGIGLYFRELISGDWVLITMLTIPAVLALLEALENTIFRWANDISKHETAVQVWGHWIREADNLDEFSSSNGISTIGEEIEKLKQNYIDCMNRTAQIPNKKFLKYKVEYKIKRLKSEKIDGMDLEELQSTRIWRN